MIMLNTITGQLNWLQIIRTNFHDTVPSY